jgi:Platelet-activating factor acetylhydrolase, isoform II
MMKRSGGRFRRSLAILAATVVLVIVGTLAALWFERGTELTLPEPTGPFSVGRVITAWSDPTTLDTLSPTPHSPRELLIWMWYPAAIGGVPAEYLPGPMRAAVEQPGGMLRFLTHDLSRVRGHSTENPDVSLREESYPVAILRGGASASVVNYTTLAEDLASHGYIVVGIDAPYRTNVVVLPDGRVMKRLPENNPELCDGAEKLSCFNRLLNAWTADIGFVLNRLTALNASDPSGKFAGRIDMTRVGVFGHSFGGSQAAQFCHDDSRCAAGIDIDGIPLGSVIHEGMRQPFMFVFSDQIHATDPESRRVQADIQSIYDRLPVDGRWRLSIRGSNHFTFSDDGALLKSGLVRGALRMFGALKIDGARQLAVTAYCVRSFFDGHVKETSRSSPAIASPLYPEIEFLD